MTAVLLFARAPRLGHVKTRLAREVGEAAALAAYERVGREVALRVGAKYPLTVWYDPPGAEMELRAWLGGWAYAPQQGADLGERLAHAFDTHFARGECPVIAVGADAAEVDAGTVDEAVRALDRADVVLGPALDGGYYLIGLARPAPQLFRGVPWGSDAVYRVTAAACRRSGLRLETLEVQRDLDTADDLRALGLLRS